MHKMINILANDGISKIGEEKLINAGFNVITTKVAQEQLSKVINEKNISVLLVRSATKVNKDIIDACPKLKIVGRGGVGLDNIDVKYAEKKGLDTLIYSLILSFPIFILLGLYKSIFRYSGLYSLLKVSRAVFAYGICNGGTEHRKRIDTEASADILCPFPSHVY